MDPWYIDPLDLTTRLVLAFILGGLIGLEREQSNHAAGFRTHILVCLGSALIMLLSVYGFPEFANEENVRMDPARLAAQVVSGIGFLGAGVILRYGFSIIGLTTAASLWVVAAIGLAVGAGFYLAAVIVTGIVLFSLLVLNKVEQKWLRRSSMYRLKISAQDKPGILVKISSIFEIKGIDIRRMSIEQEAQKEGQEEDQKYVVIHISVKIARRRALIQILDEIRAVFGVKEVSTE
jgi:putative Mg2+ transporter-C (MgtC) family protein